MSGHGQQFEHEELLSALAQDYGAYGASNPDQFAGLICIASVVFLWVGSSELIQYIFDDMTFEKPLFLTAYSTSLFSIYLLGFIVVPGWRRELRRSHRMLFGKDARGLGGGSSKPPPSPQPQCTIHAADNDDDATTPLLSTKKPGPSAGGRTPQGSLGSTTISSMSSGGSIWDLSEDGTPSSNSSLTRRLESFSANGGHHPGMLRSPVGLQQSMSPSNCFPFLPKSPTGGMHPKGFREGGQVGLMETAKHAFISRKLQQGKRVGPETEQAIVARVGSASRYRADTMDSIIEADDDNSQATSAMSWTGSTDPDGEHQQQQQHYEALWGEDEAWSWSSDGGGGAGHKGVGAADAPSWGAALSVGRAPRAHSEELHLHGSSGTGGGGGHKGGGRGVASARRGSEEEEHGVLDAKEGSGAVLAPHEVAVASALFVPIWLAAGYTFNLSLCTSCGTGTSVASNTVISSTTSLWALLMSVMMLDEKASVAKLAAVIISCVGAALITGQDQGESSVVGDALCLASAVLFGLCSVLLKRFAPKEDSLNMPMFFGFLGLFHTVLCLPLLYLLNHFGIEKLDPISQNLMAFLTLNGLFGTVLSNVLWARAIVLTSPLTVNLGTSTSIPISFIADYINPRSAPPNMAPEYILGALLVLGSFVVVSVLEADDKEGKSRACTPRLMSGVCTPKAKSGQASVARSRSDSNGNEDDVVVSIAVDNA